MAHKAPWTLTISSDLRLLPMARAFVEAVCQVAGFDEKATHAIVTATDEATNNVMRHAHRGQPDAPLQIQCFFRSDGLEIQLIDQGAPFDLAAVPKLDPSEERGRVELSAAGRARQHAAHGETLRTRGAGVPGSLTDGRAMPSFRPLDSLAAVRATASLRTARLFLARVAPDGSRNSGATVSPDRFPSRRAPSVREFSESWPPSAPIERLE